MFRNRYYLLFTIGLAAGALSATVLGCSDDTNPPVEAGVDGMQLDAGVDLPAAEGSVPDLPAADVGNDQALPDQNLPDLTWPDLPPPDGRPYDASHSSHPAPGGPQHWMLPGRHIDEGWRLAPFKLWQLRAR